MILNTSNRERWLRRWCPFLWDFCGTAYMGEMRLSGRVLRRTLLPFRMRCSTPCEEIVLVVGNYSALTMCCLSPEFMSCVLNPNHPNNLNLPCIYLFLFQILPCIYRVSLPLVVFVALGRAG